MNHRIRARNIQQAAMMNNQYHEQALHHYNSRNKFKKCNE